MGNNLIVYAYRFRLSQLSNQYKSLGDQCIYAIKPTLAKHIPVIASNPAFTLFCCKVNDYFYIGVITRNYSVGEELKPEEVNPCFVASNTSKILHKGWLEAKVTNQSTNIEPGFYYL